MSNAVAPSYFVFEGNDLTIFDSLESLCVGLEGVDVEDGVYEAFCSDGRPLELSAHGVRRGLFVIEIGRVSATVRNGPAEPDRFSQLLRSHLRALSVEVEATASLSDLVVASLRIHGHDDA